MTVNEAIIKPKPHFDSHTGTRLCVCKICGKRGTGRMVAAHVRMYHLGVNGIGMPVEKQKRK